MWNSLQIYVNYVLVGWTTTPCWGWPRPTLPSLSPGVSTAKYKENQVYTGVIVIFGLYVSHLERMVQYLPPAKTKNGWILLWSKTFYHPTSNWCTIRILSGQRGAEPNDMLVGKIPPPMMFGSESSFKHTLFSICEGLWAWCTSYQKSITLTESYCQGKLTGVESRFKWSVLTVLPSICIFIFKVHNLERSIRGFGVLLFRRVL